jgi:UDP-glucuronate 4-epimerase
MHVTVTGAAGFIGSHTCEALVARGHRVTGVDVFDSYLYPAELKLQTATHLVGSLPRERFALVEGDICDPDAMARLCGDADVVCHLAALAGVRPSIAEPLRYTQTNVHGTCVVLEAMRRAGKSRLVFASSSSVYGARGTAGRLDQVQPFREDDPCLAPASPYAASKRAGELFCSTYRDLFGIGISCLRFFTVYGPRQRPDMAIRMFADAIDQGRPIRLFGDGSSRRDYTFIDDIASGVVAACERVQPGAYNIYNLGGTATTSLAELVALLEEVVGKPALVERLPDQPGDVPITWADITGAARDLDYRPKTALPDGLRAFWHWATRPL